MAALGPKPSLTSVLPTIRAPKIKRAHLRKYSWLPDVFRIKGSIIGRIVGPVLTVTFWSAFVCYASEKGYRLVMMNSIVPLLSVVVGLILVFRNSTSYERYWEGRKAFAALTTNTRNIARIIWINVSLPPTDEQPGFTKGKTPTTDLTNKQLRRRKVDALRLCLSFVFAAKHYLRGEDGVNYADYQGVLPPSFARFDEVGYNTQRTHPSGTYSATENSREASRSGTVTPSDRQNRPDATKRVRPKRSKPQIADTTTPLLHDVHSSVEYHPFADQASLPLPLIIAHELSRAIYGFRRDGFLETVGPAGTQPSSRFKRTVAIVGNLTRAMVLSNPFVQRISGMVDQLTAMERVANTPIPVSYSIHLKQCVTLYLFALPMTLVHELGWTTVPVITLVAFTFMGIEGIADEIEQPFGVSLYFSERWGHRSDMIPSLGNDQRDLPLDRYCQDLKEEVYYIIERLPEGGEGVHGFDDGEGDD
ncbi:hypothetical protein CVT26_009621 [Gymnopilus dilepis]|uniref:Uncharacterized protein n=1 Tax=Gymnopilus dilepis TaxID=231916 RepID=A0A409VKQ2_9AGAR|nr:hypothetical protein CVT26_009621 [Gymnopilus dilepis]